MESEVREIFRTVLERPSSGLRMATRIRQRFSDVAETADLELPNRTERPRAAEPWRVIVLDTNVVSELIRKAAEPRVVSWVDRFSASDVLVTAVTATELRYGVAQLPGGRRKRELHIKVGGLLIEDFQDQIRASDSRPVASMTSMTPVSTR